MSPKKEEESSSSEPSSVTLRGGSDSEESDRYSQTSPRQNRHHRFFGSPTEEASLAPVEKEEESASSPRNASPSPPRTSTTDKREYLLKGKSPAVLRNVPVHDWETPNEPKDWPSWGNVKTREYIEQEDNWNKEWEAGGKRAARRRRDVDTRGSSPPPNIKEESSALDNLSPRSEGGPFDDPPNSKYKSVGVITSGGGADSRPVKMSKGWIPASMMSDLPRTCIPPCNTSVEPMGLENGEEFIFVKISKDKCECWPTFINDDPSTTPIYQFTTEASITAILAAREHCNQQYAWRGKNDDKGVPVLKPKRHQHRTKVEPAVQRKPLTKTKRRRWRKAKVKSTVMMIAESLHDLNLVGIDNCSAVSVSNERGDFPLYLDETMEAKDSVVLNGVGGANASIGGHGPMVVRAKDSEGNNLVVFDPAGVYLDCGTTEGEQARFRIVG
jgi:hypothetical protein